MKTEQTQTTTTDTLNVLAQRVAWLSPDRRDPHRFHEEKSEIVNELRRLARAG